MTMLLTARNLRFLTVTSRVINQLTPSSQHAHAIQLRKRAFRAVPQGAARPHPFSIAENAPPAATIAGQPIISHLDHIVLTVGDIDASVEFYTRVMGMRKEVFGDVKNGKGRVALVFGNQKINLQHERAKIEPHAEEATKGSADLCFITHHPIPTILAHLESLDELQASSDALPTPPPTPRKVSHTSLSEPDFDRRSKAPGTWTSPHFRSQHFSAQRILEPMILEPCIRTGATGKIRSVYLRDPDGNLIEISHYEPGLV